MGVINVNSFDNNYSVKLDEVSSTLLYVGEAAIGADPAAAVWRIRKLDTSATVLSVLWADGNQLFDNVWNSRSSLSYS